jgi:hypothetical protein
LNQTDCYTSFKSSRRISPAVRQRNSASFARAFSTTAATREGISGIRFEIGTNGFSKIALTVSEIPAFGERSKACAPVKRL